MVPVAVLFIPAAAVAIGETHSARNFQRVLSAGICLCLLWISIQGFFQFKSWSDRINIRCNDEFQQIASVLEAEEYENGYGTFWNANILTELSDGEIEVWTVNAFDENTTEHPDLCRWLQARTHDGTMPNGKVFVIWTSGEYHTYEQMDLDYIGKSIYHSDDFVVFEVKQ
jgi:hypothetical protein